MMTQRPLEEGHWAGVTGPGCESRSPKGVNRSGVIFREVQRAFVFYCKLSGVFFFVPHKKTISVGENGVGVGVMVKIQDEETLTSHCLQIKNPGTCEKPFEAIRSLEPWAI